MQLTLEDISSLCTSLVSHLRGILLYKSVFRAIVALFFSFVNEHKHAAG